MDRMHYDADHLAFGEAFRAFTDKVIAPHYLDWEGAGITPREVFQEAGRGGFLGMAVPEQFGGGGVDDFRFNQILDEQIAAAGITGSGLGISLHNDICLPYFLTICTDEQKQRWLPGIASGELITAVAMTEPGAGSDLSGIRTSAKRDGDSYLVNGSKTFITNGINADLVITAVRTGEDRHKGISLLILERGMDGFERGRNLDKLGMHSQDTAELSFTDVRVPAANLLGEEGAGFSYLTDKLPQERISIAISAVGEARGAFDETLAYVKDRKAFGTTIGSFQNTKFVLAELATEIDIAEAFVDRCVDRLSVAKLSAADASKAKWWTTEMQARVIDKCLQLHGGYGYMAEYAISRRYADARITRIYGGTTEIMKSVVSKSLGL
ncbi:MAG TPA: acyl-CoA dehydrogenase family protein [Jatrophihabitans sp.]|jgi:alkylation response protein AidB-like acyl-CoA dehydrogenase|uniref:acyl-CoA dehydrogenase family protein n=1 Tax=Jatrophihabitans sp. TaxID=1932789 RepID=UPI002E03CDCB|nr:acyl-CoA dehydrogenase family protein [Jatrophihabitans sp.]